MITLTREEAQQVLDAMLKFGRPIADQVDEEVYYGAAETLRARLAQPEPEPWGGVDFDIKTAPPQRERVQFPRMLRKMWSGTEVQAWLDENVNKEMK